MTFNFCWEVGYLVLMRKCSFRLHTFKSKRQTINYYKVNKHFSVTSSLNCDKHQIKRTITNYHELCELLKPTGKLNLKEKDYIMALQYRAIFKRLCSIYMGEDFCCFHVTNSK